MHGGILDRGDICLRRERFANARESFWISQADPQRQAAESWFQYDDRSIAAVFANTVSAASIARRAY